jgi:hypothetical protein
MQLTFAWAGFESTTHFSLSGAECGSCHIDVQCGGQAAFNCGGLGAVHHNPERERAEALGWTAQDLFGLHDPPEQRGPNYRRVSRYDVVGLIRLLHGWPVVALTADRAVIGTGGSGVTFYRMATQTTERHGESMASYSDLIKARKRSPKWPRTLTMWGLDVVSEAEWSQTMSDGRRFVAADGPTKLQPSGGQRKTLSA